MPWVRLLLASIVFLAVIAAPCGAMATGVLSRTARTLSGSPLFLSQAEIGLGPGVQILVVDVAPFAGTLDILADGISYSPAQGFVGDDRASLTAYYGDGSMARVDIVFSVAEPPRPVLDPADYGLGGSSAIPPPDGTPRARGTPASATLRDVSGRATLRFAERRADALLARIEALGAVVADFPGEDATPRDHVGGRGASRRLGIWSAAFTAQGARGGALTTSHEGGDAAAGFDWRFAPGIALGLAAGAGFERGGIGSGAVDFSVLGGDVALYAAWNPHAVVRIGLFGGAGRTFFRERRKPADFGLPVEGARQADYRLASVAVGLDLPFWALRISPRLAADIVEANMVPWAEDGALGLAFGREKMRAHGFGAGGAISARLPFLWGWFVPRAEAEWRTTREAFAMVRVAWASTPEASLAELPATRVANSRLRVGLGARIENGPFALDVAWRSHAGTGGIRGETLGLSLGGRF